MELWTTALIICDGRRIITGADYVETPTQKNIGYSERRFRKIISKII